MQLISGSHAIVTGGSSGIGFASARALAARGLKVSLMASRLDPLEEAASRLREDGAEVAAAACDVADRDALHAGVAELVARQGPAAVLVTSAGIAFPGYFAELDHERYRQQMEVNYFGTLHAIQAVAPSMVDHRRASTVRHHPGRADPVDGTDIEPHRWRVERVVRSHGAEDPGRRLMSRDGARPLPC